MTFQHKKLHSQETLGERLQDVREEAGLSLEAVARELNIQAKYLSALEEGRTQDLPGPVYARAFLKRYAEHLTLNSELVLRQFDEEQRVVTSLRSSPRFRPLRAGVPRAVFTPTLWRRLAVALFVVLIFGYLGLELTRFLVAPDLTVTDPAVNEQTSADSITVAGRTAPESTLTLNGQEIAVAPDGSFRESLTLSPGLNTIVLQVHRKRSRTRSVTRHILRTAAPEPLAP